MAFPSIVPDEVLEFSIDGQDISTTDRSVDIVTLDLLGSNDLETTVGDVSAEAAVIAQAADFLRTTSLLAESEGRYWDDVSANPDGFARNAVLQHLALLDVLIISTDPGVLPEDAATSWASRIRDFLAEHPEYTAKLAPALDEMAQLAG